MYGIIKNSLKDMVIETFGVEKWNEIIDASGFETDHFMSNEPYPDEDAMKLVVNGVEILDIPLNDLLFSFGKWWILKTTMEKYKFLMNSAGSNFKEFIYALPDFHTRIFLFYPKFTPPEFKIEEKEDGTMHVHYFSQRSHFAPFVLGILEGLREFFENDTKITQIAYKSKGDDHDIYQLQWK